MPGTLLLSGGSDRLLNTGSITVAGGTLDLGGNTQNTSGLVTLQSGVVLNGTLLSSAQTFAGQSGLVSAVLAGGVGLTKSTDGLLELTASNLYTGLTLVNAGTLLLSGGNDRLLSTGSITVAGGTLDLGGNTQNTSGLVTLQSGVVLDGTLLSSAQTFAAQSGLVSAVLAGGVGLTKSTDGLLELTASNLYTGLTLVNAGNAAPERRERPVAEHRLDYGGWWHVGSGREHAEHERPCDAPERRGVEGGTLLSSAQTFAGQSGLVSAVLAGGVGLTKSTDGLLELTASNLYTGLTLVNAGTLLLSGGNDRLLNTGSITVAGGTLDLGGNTQNTSGLVTLQSGVVLNGTLLSSAQTFAGQSGLVSAVLAGGVGLTKSTDGSAGADGIEPLHRADAGECGNAASESAGTTGC
jgi:fibronectin-binding autotransporter adhesin